MHWNMTFSKTYQRVWNISKSSQFGYCDQIGYKENGIMIGRCGTFAEVLLKIKTMVTKKEKRRITKP